MTLIPAFEIGVWNAWIFIVPYLFTNFGLTPLLIKKKSTFWAFPSYAGLERMYLLLFYALFGGLTLYSIFLPLATGTVWFYTGLAVYLLGFAFLVLAMLTFISTPVDKPNTTGIYRISRHPWYLGMFSIYVGTGLASASWLYLLLALIWLIPIRNALMIPEERMCCERFGDAYREYMNKTPRWLGTQKSGSNSQP
jgi:protein-S-isoprenylcysteine O-methyltransferase Ste14